MTIRGLALYGLPRMDVNMVANTLPIGCSLSLLSGTFGKPLQFLPLILKKVRCEAIEIHIGNGSCLRMNRCEIGEPHYGDYGVLQTRATAVNSVASSFPNTHFYISPFLEHGSTDEISVARWFKIIKTFAPRCSPVCSAVGGLVPKNVLVEIHGNNPPHTDIVCNDGESLLDAPADWASRGKIAAYGWTFSMNGRTGHETSWTPPSQRPNSAFTSKEELMKCLHLMGY